MKKMPIVITYQETTDKGEELRYTLRSLKNITNWNGEVFVVGDSEDWFTDKITYVPMKRSAGLKHRDLYIKLRKMIMTKEIANDFIYMNDDMYIMENMPIKHLNQGEIKRYAGNKGWLKIKQRTRHWLHNHGYDTPLDYDLHVPMIFNKKKLAEALDTVEAEHPDFEIQVRSIYGNMHKLGGEYYEDGKHNWDAPITSTQDASFLVNIMDKLSEPSPYERHKKPQTASILMAVYNTQDYIKRALDSIPAVNEIVICDDGSTDNSRKVIRQWIKDNPDRNARLLWNKSNMGVGYTKNKLMDNVTSDYFTFLDSDDYFYSDIKKVLNQLSGDIVYYDLVRTDGRMYRLNGKRDRDLHPGEVRFIRTEFLGDTRNNNERHAEDEALLKKLLKKNPDEVFTRILAKHYEYPRKDSIRERFLSGKKI